jgi:hypothetical protein
MERSDFASNGAGFTLRGVVTGGPQCRISEPAKLDLLTLGPALSGLASR